MDATARSEQSTREDRMPHHLHAVVAERATPRHLCTVRPSLRNGVHNPHVVGRTVSAGHVASLQGSVGATLEAVSHAVAVKDWEYAQVLIARLKAALGTDGSAGASIREPLAEPLRARELEVIALVAAGHSNREIAEKLIVSVGTIRWHLKNIYGKLDAHSRTQAVARARAAGLLN